MLVSLICAALFVAYANGANDNFKGVATLFGGKILDYRKALSWATMSTFAGSSVSFFAGTRLLKLFSGKGIVTDTTIIDPAFVLSVGLAAALTIIIATSIGMPISTTHSLLGAITGAGIAGHNIASFNSLLKSFLVPLIVGPVIALVITTVIYALFHLFRTRLKIESSTCFCIGSRQELLMGAPGLYVIRSTGLSLAVEDEKYCRSIYTGSILGIHFQRLVDFAHILSAGTVSFARGLNDTPKIAALLLLQTLISPRLSLLMIAVLMAVGGFIHSRKIANKMSFEISEMNSGQAFTGNLVTSALVILGSVLGFPLSTTHVSCGAIFGIGVVSGKASFRTILQIVLAWLATLPVAAVLAAIIWSLSQ